MQRSVSLFLRYKSLPTYVLSSFSLDEYPSLMMRDPRYATLSEALSPDCLYFWSSRLTASKSKRAMMQTTEESTGGARLMLRLEGL